MYNEKPILIIEDDMLTRYSLSRLVRCLGRRSLAASTLSSGLALLDTRPDCVILDLDLPDGPGEAVLREVRRRDLPCRVVVCTGVDDRRRLDAVQCLGPDALLGKPVGPDDFAAACRR